MQAVSQGPRAIRAQVLATNGVSVDQWRHQFLLWSTIGAHRSVRAVVKDFPITFMRCAAASTFALPAAVLLVT